MGGDDDLDVMMLLLLTMFMGIVLLVSSSCQGPRGAIGPAGPPGIGDVGPMGPSGQDGQNGQDAELVWIDPCPDLVVSYPELLLLSNGYYYGVYASGQKIHFVLLTPGNYHTTDGRNCQFTITEEGELE